MTEDNEIGIVIRSYTYDLIKSMNGWFAERWIDNRRTVSYYHTKADLIKDLNNEVVTFK